MTAALTPEDVEVRLRKPQTRSRIELAALALQAADTIADLRRQRDEAERMRQLDLDLAERHMNEKHERGRKLEAAERALAEALTGWDEACKTAKERRDEYYLQWVRAEAAERALAEARAECERQRERAEKWRAAAEDGHG